MHHEGHHLKTYEDLHALTQSFAQGRTNLVLLIGPPGLMKTETITRACRGRPYLYVNGKESPAEFYRDLYDYRDALVILDDVEPLLENKDGQVLIRALTETQATKTISWGTRTNAVAAPKSFTTKSRVFIVANTWGQGGISSAIESRGLKFRFSPPWSEVYKEAGTWFHDQEILDYVHSNLGYMTNPDVRLLKQAEEMRCLGLPGHDWRDVFDRCMEMDGADREINRLLKETHLTQQERAGTFVKNGFGDRSTFFRRLKKRRASVDQTRTSPERIVVTNVSHLVRESRTPSPPTGTMRLIPG